MRLIYAVIGTAVPKKNIIREMEVTRANHAVDFLFEEDIFSGYTTQNEKRRAMIDAATNVLFVWEKRSIYEWIDYTQKQGKPFEVVNPDFILA